MTIPRHRLIKERREQLGIGIGELARRIGLETSMYWDVELYDDELTMAFSLENVRSLWPAPGSEDTELGVLMELEVGHGETAIYARVQT